MKSLELSITCLNIDILFAEFEPSANHLPHILNQYPGIVTNPRDTFP